MIYGVFDGEYSDWGIRGYYSTREEAEKYCCIHTDCYFYEMKDLSGTENLSDITVYYEEEIGFNLISGGETNKLVYPFNEPTRFIKTENMRNEPNRHTFYSAYSLRDNHIEYNFRHGWLYFYINTLKPNDRKRCEKIALDYLAELYGDKGYITKEDIDAMNERFKEVMY